MDISRCTRRLSLVMLSGLSCSLSAQEPVVAKVSQVLPFASSGTVMRAASAAAPPEETSSRPAATERNTIGQATQAGGRISTAQDSTTSLVIGTLGSARMGADSEVKVPDAGEGGHSLELLKGQLFMNISADELRQRNEGEFKLKTPAALLAVKGTRFFATIRDGVELIGVHEGQVTVQDASSSATVDLTEGMVVSLSDSGPSAVRSMSAEEQDTRLEYDLASLTRSALPQSRWEPLKTRQAGTQRPAPLPDGNIRFTWPLLDRKSLVYHETYFEHGVSAEDAPRTVGLELSLRVIGVDSLTLSMECMDSQKTLKRFSQKVGGGAEWQTFILPFSALNTGFRDHTPVRLSVFPAVVSAADRVTKGGALALKRGGALELRPVRLLQKPK